MTPIWDILAMQFSAYAQVPLEKATLAVIFPMPDRRNRFYMDGRTYVRKQAFLDRQKEKTRDVRGAVPASASRS